MANTWGELKWSEGLWGLQGDINVNVSTPGTSTTWGSSTWGSNAWAAIDGISSSIGSDVFVQLSQEISVTGFQLNCTAVSVSITADSNLNLDTNLLNSTTGTVTGEPSIEVQVTSPGNLPWGTESWGYGSWGNIGGMDISIGADAVLIPSIDVDVIGNQLNTTTGIFSITGDASLTLTGTDSATTTGTVTAQIDIDLSVTGQSIATTVATVSITADANIDVNGSLLTVSLGDEEADITADVFLTGNVISLSLGSAELDANTLVDVTSVSAITIINSVSIIIDVAPSITGLQMTTYAGNVFISAWAVVDIGISNSWTIVNTSATNTWAVVDIAA